MLSYRSVVTAASLTACAGVALGLPSMPGVTPLAPCSPNPLPLTEVYAPAPDPQGVSLRTRRDGGGGPADAPCYPNCDNSTTNPVLTANDFQCFLTACAAGCTAPDCYSNCDGSTAPNSFCTANDFQCFMNLYAAGCS